MRILLSNDDGYLAEGLRVLAEALGESHEISVVAPERNCSGASNSLTLGRSLRTQTSDNGFVFINGTPTDCVHLAITGLLEKEPNMVVSGINAGANMGDDVIYSGTVAAAMEGRFLGLPAIAVSMVSFEPRYYSTAARAVVQVVEQLQENPIKRENHMKQDSVLNINVPDLPWEQIKGIKVTRLGNRHKSEGVIIQQDPWGESMYWVGPPGKAQDAGEGTDFHAVEHGYISVTPLHIDLTRYDSLQSLAGWLEAGWSR